MDNNDSNRLATLELALICRNIDVNDQDSLTKAVLDAYNLGNKNGRQEIADGIKETIRKNPMRLLSR